MKFRQYITEEYGSLAAKKIWNMIERDCKPFLKETRKGGGFLWRGAVGSGEEEIEKRTVRKDRRPRFIPEKLHEWLDKNLKDLFGWNPRSEGLFTAAHDTARIFGRARMVFPIGRFKYIVLDSKNLRLLYRHWFPF